MSLKEELSAEVATIFRDIWTTRDGQKVPAVSDLKLGNDSVSLDATILYADLDGSTKMVDSKHQNFCAEIYKVYLRCAARLIRNEGGVITAYDGDRVMAIFIGGSKNTSAVRCGLKINGAVCEIINPLLKSVYANEVFTVRHNVGVDTSRISVSRIGVKGDNDLVWVGRAANYAAKLTELPSDYPVRITREVFDNMNDSVKFCSGNYIWEKASWTNMSGIEIYRTRWFYYVK